MSYRIMVVEDSKLIYAEMGQFLMGTEFEIVRFCRSGEEALAVYEETKPDLVTMDIVMPGMDGIETAVQLLTRWPEARLLMVSALAYDDTMKMVTDIGAKGFLCKPFQRKGLQDAICAALEH